MAFIFTMRSPTPNITAAPNTTAAQPGSIDDRLSTIMENGDAPPPPSAVKASHRPSYRRWQLGSPPSFRFESPPPPYIEDIGPHGEKLSDVRNNKHIARRGGWKRLCIILIVLTAVIVALAVGLAVGLNKSKSTKPGGDAPAQGAATTGAPTPDGPFPVGSYSMVTFLDTVATGCTSNPSAWLCYPYTTYNESTTKSAATYDWVIKAVKPTSSSGSSLTISSTNNPFALTFKDVPLDLLDVGQSSERYRFQVPMDKVVVPTTPITNDNSRASCWFNGTTFQAQLYTKRAKTYPPAADAGGPPAAAGGTPTAGMKSWPFAVDVKQVIGGGQDIPECYKVRDGNVGDRITDGLAPVSTGGLCTCVYKNWNGS